MKKIAVWKVIVLSLITCWIYAIFWTARNRDYLEKYEKSVGKIPRWLWLVSIVAFSGIAFGVAVVVLMLGYSGVMTAETTLLVFGLACVSVGVYALGVGLWWLWYFAKAMEIVTQGRIRRPASLVLYIFVGPFVIAFYQYYINRLADNKKGATYKESGGLWTLIAVCICLSIGSLALSVVDTTNTLQEMRTSIERGQVNYREMTRLNAEYNTCIDALNEKYPNEQIEPADEEVYNAAYDRCEEKYAQYEAAYDRYMNSLQ